MPQSILLLFLNRNDIVSCFTHNRIDSLSVVSSIIETILLLGSKNCQSLNLEVYDINDWEFFV